MGSELVTEILENIEIAVMSILEIRVRSWVKLRKLICGAYLRLLNGRTTNMLD